MSLLFGAALTDKVVYAGSSALALGGSGTWMLWLYQTNSGTHQRWLQGVTGDRELEFSGSGNLSLYVGTTGAYLEATAATSNFANYGTNKWMFTAARYVFGGASTDQKVLIGDQYKPAAEPSSYSTQIAGTGSLISDSGTVWNLSSNVAGNNFPFVGSIALLALFNRAMSTGEILWWQQESQRQLASGVRPLVLPTSCKLWSMVGDHFHGKSIQPDWSGYGALGTVTGASPSEAPPFQKRRARRRIVPSAPAASGAMTATAAIAFSSSSTLSGQGSLAGSTTLAFTPSSTLVGAGALAGSAAVTFSDSATLLGSGSLVGSAPLTFSTNTFLVGSGDLAGTTTITFTPTGSMNVTGAMSASATLTFSESPLLAGSGSLAGSSTLTLGTSPVLSGSGALAGSAALEFYPGSGQAHRSLSTGLFEWFSMGESAGAARVGSIGGYSLADHNTVGQGTGNGSQFTYASTYNGSSQYNSLNNSAFNWTAGQPQTLAFWIKHNDTGFSHNYTIAAMDASGTNRQWRAAISNGQPTFFVFDNGTSNGQVTWNDPAGHITANVWHLILAWYDPANNKIWIQVDGGEAVSAAYSGGTTPGTSDFTVGRLDEIAGQYFDGSIGPVAYWQNHLLDAQERADYYRQGPYPFRTRCFVKHSSNADPHVDLPQGTDIAVYEGHVWDSNITGRLQMVHTRAPDSTHSYVAQQHSSDGVSFTVEGDVIGGGAGGEAATDVARPHFYDDGVNHWLWYSDASNSNLRVAKTTDDATWTRQAQNLITLGATIQGVANVCAIKLGSTYYVPFEWSDGTGGFGQWHLGLASTSAPDSGPYTVLRTRYTTLEGPAGNASGPTVYQRSDGIICMIYHRGTLSRIFFASISEADFVAGNDNWTVHNNGYPLIQITESGVSALAPYNPDQAADPMLVEISGQTHLYYDSDQNTPSLKGCICLAVYPVTLDWTLYELAGIPAENVLSGAGALSGSALLTFTDSSVLDGAGLLAGTSTTTFSESPTLSGSGSLAGAAALTFSDVADLTGIGSSAMVGTSTVVFSTSSTMAGAGRLAGAATVTFSPTATSSSSGVLAGTSTLTFSSTATLASGGNLTSHTSINFTASGDLLGSGSLSGTAPVTFTSASVLSGSGAMVATSAITFSESAILIGLAPLTASSQVTFGDAASLTGSGSLAGTSSLTFSVTSALVGAGSLVGTAPLTFTAIAAPYVLHFDSSVAAVLDEIVSAGSGTFSHQVVPARTITILATPTNVITLLAEPSNVISIVGAQNGMATEYDINCFRRERITLKVEISGVSDPAGGTYLFRLLDRKGGQSLAELTNGSGISFSTKYVVTDIPATMTDRKGGDYAYTLSRTDVETMEARGAFTIDVDSAT